MTECDRYRAIASNGKLSAAWHAIIIAYNVIKLGDDEAGVGCRDGNAVIEACSRCDRAAVRGTW